MKKQKLKTQALTVAILLTLFFSGCFKWWNPWVIEVEPNTKEIYADSVTVIFPEGSIIPTKATLKKVSDAEIQYTFDETADIFRVKDKSPFQYILNIGNNPPQNDSISVTIKLPNNTSSQPLANYGYEFFVQVLQDGGEETLDLFEIIPSTFNPTTNTINVNIPIWAFTNKRNTSKTYEAIFTIASTPGAPVIALSIDSLGEMKRAGAGSPDDKCEAGQISCPIGSIDDCKAKRTSPYGTRIDPVTGKKGQMHWGIDFGIPIGTTINAVSDGKVEKIRTQTDKQNNVIGYGLYMVIRHTDGSASLYAHLSNTTVKVGDAVKANQQIALSGNSGKSTGPHLHMEYVPNGEIIQSKNRIDAYPCISSNASGSITIRDNGNLADDAFELFLDGVLIGRTDIGAANSASLSNLRPGEKTLTLKCIIAPDNVGTYEVLLQDGLSFTDNGGDIKSGTLAQGASISWRINVPAKPQPRPAMRKAIVNSYIEKPITQ